MLTLGTFLGLEQTLGLKGNSLQSESYLFNGHVSYVNCSNVQFLKVDGAMIFSPVNSVPSLESLSLSLSQQAHFALVSGFRH